VKKKKDEKKEKEIAEDRKESVIAKIQWLCFTRQYLNAIQKASELIEIGSVNGCILTRAEKAELTEIKAYCEKAHPAATTTTPKED